MIDQFLVERHTMGRVMQGLYQALAHQRGRAETTVKPITLHHIYDGADATTLFANH